MIYDLLKFCCVVFNLGIMVRPGPLLKYLGYVELIDIIQARCVIFCTCMKYFSYINNKLSFSF